ncbi:MAG TPA: PDZ domain-containing protein, partial [Longimicrobiales bacterium]|nr:PDZ domain-containing protein [Longimicrobiales bacterium]
RPLAPYIWGQNRVAGAEVIPLNPELAAYFHVAQGLLVTDVTEGSPTGEAGIQPGDVVVQVGRTVVTSLGDLRRALSRQDAVPLALRIIRRGETLEVTLPR